MALTEDDVRRAEAEMEELRHSTATAVAVRHDRRIGRIVVRLNSGLEVAFPPHEAQGLETAKSSDLDEIEISPSGLGLHFPKLDADLYIPALLEGFNGSREWMTAGARRRASLPAHGRPGRQFQKMDPSHQDQSQILLSKDELQRRQLGMPAGSGSNALIGSQSLLPQAPACESLARGQYSDPDGSYASSDTDNDVAAARKRVQTDADRQPSLGIRSTNASC